jgi:hypothetical protein
VARALHDHAFHLIRSDAIIVIGDEHAAPGCEERHHPLVLKRKASGIGGAAKRSDAPVRGNFPLGPWPEIPRHLEPPNVPGNLRRTTAGERKPIEPDLAPLAARC